MIAFFIFFYLSYMRIIHYVMRIIHSIIKCPQDSVYRHKFIRLDLTIPSNYPYEPPQVSFVNYDGVRIHPNMYESGKCCSTILNTWGDSELAPCRFLDTPGVVMPNYHVCEGRKYGGFQGILTQPHQVSVFDKARKEWSLPVKLTATSSNCERRSQNLFVETTEAFYAGIVQAVGTPIHIKRVSVTRYLVSMPRF
jgi:hypothetical protein